MRSLPVIRRIPSARRVAALVLSLAVLTSLAGTAVVAEPATADDNIMGDPRAAGGAGGAAAARAAANPDQPTLPVSCRPTYGYMEPEPCRLVPRKPGAPLIVLWGDSHGWMMTPAIRRAVAGKNVNVVSILQGSCPVMDPDFSTPEKYAARNGCDELGRTAITFLKNARKFKRPMRVIVAMSWELYHNVTDPPNAADKRYPGFSNDYIRTNARKGLTGTPRAFKALARMRIRTDIVAAQPMVYQNAPACPAGDFRCDLPRQGVLKDAKENNARIRALRDLLSVKGSIIRPAKSLCDETTCVGTFRGVPTYWDPLHIGQRASYQLAGHFAPSVRAILEEAAGQRPAGR